MREARRKVSRFRARVVTSLKNMAILLRLKRTDGDTFVTMKLLQRIPALSSLTLCTLTALCGALCDQAHASSGAHAPSLSDLTFYWINFVLYVALMVFLLRKPIRSGWAARTTRIQQSVSECTDQVDAAERELNAIEALTKGLATEQERVCQEIVSQANLEADDIVRSATQRATRIREQAKEMLKGETRSAQLSFRASLIARAMELAREKFTKGEYAAREQTYVGAAVARAKSLLN